MGRRSTELTMPDRRFPPPWSVAHAYAYAMRCAVQYPARGFLPLWTVEEQIATRRTCVITVKGRARIYPFTLGPVAPTRGLFLLVGNMTLSLQRLPLPAALVRRGIGCLLCRARPQRAKARLRLFRG
jgi:hypothetical protein